ncbi:MAG: hypothetical protein FWH15_06270 [Betaproteobacteria bacterium]|nr:hypothetical protein [Betaproteobacteria bacterium]
MADLIDLAQAQSAPIEAAQLAYRRPAAPDATGYCLNCGEPIDDRRWCDAACRDDWERRDRIMRARRL